jgi:hypothetical protein
MAADGHLIFHTTTPPPAEFDLPDGRAIFRHATFRGETRGVLLRGFQRPSPVAVAEAALNRYVTDHSGDVADWEIVEVTPAEYGEVEQAVFGPLRAARAAVREVSLQELRDTLIAQTVKVSEMGPNDRVFKVPTNVWEAREFFKAFALALREVEDLVP